MIHFNKLKRINGEFSRLNLYSIIPLLLASLMRSIALLSKFQHSSKGVPLAQ